MKDWIERPQLFRSFWPSITHIKCAACNTFWRRPEFASHEACFPPRPTSSDQQVALTRAHCPRCGVLMPELADLLEAGLASESAVADKPFTGTVSGVRQFLADSSGSAIQLWEYVVSHRHLTLKIDSNQDSTHAFVRCIMTRSIELPRLSWRGSLTLEPTDDEERWQLLDEAANARIVCELVGVFHQLTSLV